MAFYVLCPTILGEWSAWLMGYLLIDSISMAGESYSVFLQKDGVGKKDNTVLGCVTLLNPNSISLKEQFPNTSRVDCIQEPEPPQLERKR